MVPKLTNHKNNIPGIGKKNNKKYVNFLKRYSRNEVLTTRA